MKQFSLSLLTLLLLSCQTDGEGECVTYGQASTVGIEGPTTGRLDEVLPLVVSFSVNSGCGQFDRFTETGTGTARTVQVQALYAGCVCTTNVPIRQTTYTFKAAQPGVYEVKFWKSDTDFVTHTVTVQ